MLIWALRHSEAQKSIKFVWAEFQISESSSRFSDILYGKAVWTHTTMRRRQLWTWLSNRRIGWMASLERTAWCSILNTGLLIPLSLRIFILENLSSMRVALCHLDQLKMWGSWSYCSFVYALFVWCPWEASSSLKRGGRKIWERRQKAGI